MKTFNEYLAESGEIGFIEAVNYTVVSVSGLPNAKPLEIIMLETGDIGYLLGLHKDYADVLMFSKNTVKTGTKVTRTNRTLSITASMNLLGKTIDPFGKPLDERIDVGLVNAVDLPIDVRPPGINSRKRISKTLETGVAIVDLILPLGKGQRELIIGDRKTGKTNFLLQTMLTQARQGVVCIYVAIGKKQLSYKKIEEYLRANNIMDQCIIVATAAEEAPGSIFMSPYSGMTLAEYFREQGKDVLVIFDDLTTHARYYRQISLLMKRFPGRNSYPADIFYAHSRLLERAGNFIMESGQERAISCLPVAETVQGDLSGYIQTNLMSITDGHLYFDIDLFEKGRRPPVHPFLSVTRIGRQTQDSLRQTLSREIISFLSLYEKMQNFTHFGAEISETVSATLSTGTKITAFFDYISSNSIPLYLQIFLFSLLWIDIWREKSIEVMKEDIERITVFYNKDEAIRKEVSSLLEGRESFNQLLGEIRGKPDEFYKKLGFFT
jgi:F-type H+/Na+-transporting ATPase subunit alpha